MLLNRQIMGWIMSQSELFWREAPEVNLAYHLPKLMWEQYGICSLYNNKIFNYTLGSADGCSILGLNNNWTVTLVTWFMGKKKKAFPVMAIWTNVLELQEANAAGGGRAHCRLAACCAPSPHLFVWLNFCSCSCSKTKAKHWSDHPVGVDRVLFFFCCICTSEIPDKWSNIRKSTHIKVLSGKPTHT